MMKKLTKVLFSIALMTLAAGAFANKGEQWLTDMDEAQKVAKAEGKSIMMFYTGSDWCVWCINLDNEVFVKEEFLSYAKDNLVLVDLDFPREEGVISKEQQAHNDKWIEKIPARGFPTVYLTDADAKPYAHTGYRAGGPVKYVELLKSMIAGYDDIVELKAKAAKATGVTRAKLLDELLSSDTALVDNRSELNAEVMALAENTDEALYNKYRSFVGQRLLSKALLVQWHSHDEKKDEAENVAALLKLHEEFNYVDDCNGWGRLYARLGDSYGALDKHDEFIQFMDKAIADKSYSVERHQDQMYYKAMVTAAKGDLETAITFMDQAMAMAPETGLGKKKREHMINRLKGKLPKVEGAES